MHMNKFRHFRTILLKIFQINVKIITIFKLKKTGEIISKKTFYCRTWVNRDCAMAVPESTIRDAFRRRDTEKIFHCAMFVKVFRNIQFA
jgi:hypothetical protein